MGGLAGVGKVELFECYVVTLGFERVSKPRLRRDGEERFGRSV